MKVKFYDQVVHIDRRLVLNEIKYQRCSYTERLIINVPVKGGKIEKIHTDHYFVNDLNKQFTTQIKQAFKRHDKKRELKLLKVEHAELQRRFDQLECHVYALMEAITLPD